MDPAIFATLAIDIDFIVAGPIVVRDLMLVYAEADILAGAELDIIPEMEVAATANPNEVEPTSES